MGVAQIVFLRWLTTLATGSLFQLSIALLLRKVNANFRIWILAVATLPVNRIAAKEPPPHTHPTLLTWAITRPIPGLPTGTDARID